jgi:phenylalanyl-tRNA synthetase beta chain
MAVALDRNGEACGYVAHLHPAVARALDLPQQTAIATIDVRSLLRSGRTETRYRALPTFPELPVDVALLVPAAAKVHEVADFLRRVGRKLVRDVVLFEAYRGTNVPAGQKSLNFTVTLGAEDRTLSDADEAKFIEKVREQAAEIGAELRG